MRNQVLNDRQRKAIKKYLAKEEPRPRMGSYVRGLRRIAKQSDFEQMRADTDLLETLALAVIPIGRKPLLESDLTAEFKVRRKVTQDLNAEFKVQE